MPVEPGRLETLLRHDRAVVLAGLATVTLIAWGYLIYSASKMGGMGTMKMYSPMVMLQVQSWGEVDLLLLFVMWGVMMVAMMVPSATPLILMFARVDRQKGGSRVVTPVAILLLGYLLVWWTFSALAALAQWRLHSAALVSPAMMSTSSRLSGFLLLAAGIFQFSPLKRACLRHCRSPMSFLMSEWREGRWGTLALGVKHGIYCVGCCGFFMGLLFVAGVMNLLWVAAIGLLVLLERVAPHGERVGRITGAVLIVGGLVLVLS